MTALETAHSNLNALRQNPYPGRGLVIGQSASGSWLILYWIMGRSVQSRNRRFTVEGGSLRTESVDVRLVKDPSLIIYEAMLELPGIYIVSNGDQTRTIYQALQSGRTFEAALSTREREPDAPNFTPRISGILDLRQSSSVITLSILKANPLDAQHTDRFTYHPALPQMGFGVGLTTYRGDGNPLPSFSGDPVLLPFHGSAERILDTYWEALNPENRVSLAVKEIPAQEGMARLLVYNRY